MVGYYGLIMGCSRPYWIGIMQKIYDKYGMNEWSWNEVKTVLPEISNSDLRRLNCSNWFVQSKQPKHHNDKKHLWRLIPEVELLLKEKKIVKKTRSFKRKNIMEPSAAYEEEIYPE